MASNQVLHGHLLPRPLLKHSQHNQHHQHHLFLHLHQQPLPLQPLPRSPLATAVVVLAGRGLQLSLGMDERLRHAQRVLLPPPPPRCWPRYPATLLLQRQRASWWAANCRHGNLRMMVLVVAGWRRRIVMQTTGALGISLQPTKGECGSVEERCRLQLLTAHYVAHQDHWLHGAV